MSTGPQYNLPPFMLYTPSSVSRGQSGEKLHFHRVVNVDSFESLQSVAVSNHTVFSFKGTRKAEHWEGAEALVFDVDNDHNGPLVTPETIKQDFPDVAFCYIFSRNNGKPKNGKPATVRFHVYFPIELTTGADEVKGLISSVCEKFSYFDPKCQDLGRMIFGVAHPQGGYVTGTLRLDQFMKCQTATAAPTVPATENRCLIPAGERNATLSTYAFTVLKKFGPEGIAEAEAAFLQRAEDCNPPLSDGELSTIWHYAVQNAPAKIWNKPGYLTPAEYAVQGFQDVAPALQGEVMYRLSDLSDVAEGELFAKNFGGTVLYNKGLGWLVWNGTRFKQGDGPARKLAHKFTALQLEAAQAAFQKASAGAAKDLTNAALTEQFQKAKKFLAFVNHCRESTGIDHLLKEAAVHLETEADMLDADPAKLNTSAGIIDLRTGKLQPNDPAERCTKITTVAPSDTGADIWREFLDQITCGDTDMVRYLQELAGMAAYGKQVNEGIVLAVGDGGNGKSTLFNVLARVLGDYAGSINPKILLATGGKSYEAEAAELRGLRLALAAETEEGARLDGAAIKQYGSQDKISARPLYSKPITFWPSHTLVLFTNFLPKVGSRDAGTWSRLKVAPFKAKLRGAKGEVKDFASYLYENAGGAVLAWIVEGARRFIANGFKIELPEAARAALAEYNRENDWLQDFIDDCCDVGPNYTAGSAELYSSYSYHCQATGASFKRDLREFRNALTAAGYESKHTNKGCVFRGLQLRPTPPPEV